MEKKHKNTEGGIRAIFTKLDRPLDSQITCIKK